MGWLYAVVILTNQIPAVKHGKMSFFWMAGLIAFGCSIDNPSMSQRSTLQDWPAPFLVCFSNNLSVSKQILLEIGMFDEYFVSWGGEDIDLGLSLQEKGVNFILRRSVKSIHYPHKKNHQWDTNPEVEIKNLQAKKEYILQKHPSELVMMWMDIYNIVELNQELIKNRKQNQLH